MKSISLVEKVGRGPRVYVPCLYPQFEHSGRGSIEDNRCMYLTTSRSVRNFGAEQIAGLGAEQLFSIFSQFRSQTLEVKYASWLSQEDPLTIRYRGIHPKPRYRQRYLITARDPYNPQDLKLSVNKGGSAVPGPVTGGEIQVAAQCYSFITAPARPEVLDAIECWSVRQREPQHWLAATCGGAVAPVGARSVRCAPKCTMSALQLHQMWRGTCRRSSLLLSDIEG